MLDTDICIYAMSAAKGFEPKLPLGDCLISVIVLGISGAPNADHALLVCQRDLMIQFKYSLSFVWGESHTVRMWI